MGGGSRRSETKEMVLRTGSATCMHAKRVLMGDLDTILAAVPPLRLSVSYLRCHLLPSLTSTVFLLCLLTTTGNCRRKTPRGR